MSTIKLTVLGIQNFLLTQAEDEIIFDMHYDEAKENTQHVFKLTDEKSK